METTNDQNFDDVRDLMRQWREQEAGEGETAVPAGEGSESRATLPPPSDTEPGFLLRDFWNLMRDYKLGVVTDEEAIEKLQVLGMKTSLHFYLNALEDAEQRADEAAITAPLYHQHLEDVELDLHSAVWSLHIKNRHRSEAIGILTKTLELVQTLRNKPHDKWPETPHQRRMRYQRQRDEWEAKRAAANAEWQVQRDAEREKRRAARQRRKKAPPMA